MKKKMLWVMSMLVALLVITGCGNGDSEKDSGARTTNEEVQVDPVVYTEPSKILEKFEAGETFAFVMGHADCGACQSYLKGGLTEFEKEQDEKMMYVELKGIEADKEKFDTVEEIIKDHLDDKFEATPTTYFVVDGKVKDALIGAVTYQELLIKYEETVK